MNQKNLGRINNRLLLAKHSQYQWLLFVDVDNYPNDENFLKNYIAQIDKSMIVFGGCIYKKPKT